MIIGVDVDQHRLMPCIRRSSARLCASGPTWSEIVLPSSSHGQPGCGAFEKSVKIDHEAARRLDRYLRVRARHEQAHRLGVEVWPHRFLHHATRRRLPGALPSRFPPASVLRVHGVHR